MNNNDLAIKVENLTKIYKLYDDPVDRLKEALHWRGKKYHKDFYALNDISISIKKGETIGIIGKNGSGKSTFLKIITGVLTATSGIVNVKGKVSALLELGAGFNPEYTGIENIYFQGSLMGYSNKEIEAKVDSILAFADIGEFAFQPVKMYSSGMFARLAFAVAINVEPDILIVDEALSVGDAAFQNKCMRKMEEIRKNNVTIIFVSHDTQAVGKFCQSVVWLNKGIIKEIGSTSKVLENYISYTNYFLETTRTAIQNPNINNSNKNKIDKKDNVKQSYKLIDVANLDSFGKKDAVICRIGFINKANQLIDSLTQGDVVSFVCDFKTEVDLHDVGIGILFKDGLNNSIFTINSYMYDCSIKSVKAFSKIRCKIKFKVPKIFPKNYVLAVALSEGTQQSHEQQHWIHSALIVNIQSIDMIDDCFLTLYKDEVEYKYEQI